MPYKSPLTVYIIRYTSFKKGQEIVGRICTDFSRYVESLLGLGIGIPVSSRSVVQKKQLVPIDIPFEAKEMSQNARARIVMGGKLSSVTRFYRRIIEESHYAFKEGKPIYLVGMFGGASSLIIRAIKGEEVSKIVNEIFYAFPKIDKLYNHAGGTRLRRSLVMMLTNFRKLDIRGLVKLNGLNREENEILFSSPHFHEIIYHILIELKRTHK